jgi:hypothetical protein
MATLGDDFTGGTVRVVGMQRSRRPTFAQELPRTPELDEVVDAFARGDYASVRARASRLEQSSADPMVRKAARTLLDRTRPDPLAVVLLVVAGLILATLSSWWVAHGRPPS